MAEEIKPQHKHDCNNCTFLGTFINNDIVPNYDLYYCPQGSNPTIIARYGKDVRYMSGMQFGIANQNDEECPLGEAYRRAKKLGLC